MNPSRAPNFGVMEKIRAPNLGAIDKNSTESNSSSGDLQNLKKELMEAEYDLETMTQIIQSGQV